MKTVEGIYEEMKANYAAWSGSVIQEGGDMALRLRAAAAQVYSLWGQAAFLEKQAFPQTAEGEFLDRHAQSRGIVQIGRGVIRCDNLLSGGGQGNGGGDPDWDPLRHGGRR